MRGAGHSPEATSSPARRFGRLRHKAREETGLTLTIGDLLGTTEIVTPEEKFVICDFLASREGHEDPRAGSDAEEACFVALGSVPDLDLVDGLGDWLRRHGIGLG